MKGQTQALTTVLITTVIVGAIATGYSWGTPLLEKRESQASLNNVERDVLNLHNALIEISQSGTGSARAIDFVLDDGEIEVDSSKDHIEVRTTASNSPYPDGVWKLLRGETMQNLTIGTGAYGLKGSDMPGVVAVRSGTGASESVFYRIEFRNLKSGKSLEKLDIRGVGNTRATGEVEVVVRNTGTETDQEFIVNGQKFERERTTIEVDLE